MEIQIDMYQTLAVSVLVLILGQFLKKRINFLEKFCIPAPGKWRFVMAIGDFSISLAQTGMIPLREAARGNTPIPSNRLPNLRAHIDRLSFYFFMCYFHFSAPFQTIKKTPSMEVHSMAFVVVC